MSSVANAITYARQKAQTDSNGISDTNGLAWANNGLLDITRDLINHGIDAAQICEASATLSPTDNPPGRFAWPSDMFALKTIEVDFTNTGGQNYLQAKKMDVANLQGDTSFDFVRKNQPTTSPIFTNHGDTGEVFPTILSSALINIFYYLTPTEYSSTGSTVNYPQSLDYRVLGDKILIAYYESLEKWDAVKRWEEVYTKKIKDSIGILAPQSKQPITPEGIRLTGYEF